MDDAGQSVVRHGDVAAVHEVDEGSQVVKVNVVEIQDGVGAAEQLGRLAGEDHGLEQGGAGTKHELVGANRTMTAGQSDVDELLLLPGTDHRVGQLRVVMVPA